MALNDCVLYEKHPNFTLPVGSVVTTQQGKKALYRDIDRRHIFSKGAYKAIATDKVVIDYLAEHGGVDEVWFRLKDEEKILATNFENYKANIPRKMAGREQCFVHMSSFSEIPSNQPLPRPTEKVVIEMGAK